MNKTTDVTSPKPLPNWNGSNLTDGKVDGAGKKIWMGFSGHVVHAMIVLTSLDSFGRIRRAPAG